MCRLLKSSCVEGDGVWENRAVLSIDRPGRRDVTLTAVAYQRVVQQLQLAAKRQREEHNSKQPSAGLALHSTTHTDHENKNTTVYMSALSTIEHPSPGLTLSAPRPHLVAFLLPGSVFGGQRFENPSDLEAAAGAVVLRLAPLVDTREAVHVTLDEETRGGESWRGNERYPTSRGGRANWVMCSIAKLLKSVRQHNHSLQRGSDRRHTAAVPLDCRYNNTHVDGRRIFRNKAIF